MFFQQFAVCKHFLICFIFFRMTDYYEEKILLQFSRNIRIRRHELNLTQEELSELMDIHVNSIGRIERGQANPSITMLFRLAKALQINPCDLIKNLKY